MAWQSKYKNVKPVTPRWFIAAAVVSALMLATAHAFETFGHLAPCELCLHQREGYWAALWVGLIGYGVARWRHDLARPLLLLVALVFLGETVVAAYHAGVEWKWWAGPARCTGARTSVSASDMSALLSGAKIHIVRCDEAAWRMFGLSMAGWNTLVALALTVVSVVMALRLRTRR
ncbi:MAG: disulfide bond formation protein B [Caulobacteraceae bacterium]